MALYRFQKWVYDSTESTNVKTTIPVGTLDINLVAYYQQVAAFDFSLSATPASQTVIAGTPTTFGINLAVLTGAPETVLLSISGLPTYASATFNPASGIPSFSSTLNIVTAQNTPAGTYTLLITGTTGIVAHTTTVTLIVQPAVVPFDFTISASPASQNVQGGNSVTFQVATTLVAGITENVALAVSGLPSGATYSFYPQSGYPPFISTLTIQTNPSTPQGSYPLTVSGFAFVDRSTTVTLVVTTPAPFDFSITPTPASQPVVVGNQTSFAISTALLSGTSEPISLLVVSGLPLFAAASFSPVQGSPPFTSTLTILTSSNTPTGTYTVTIGGFGSVDRQTAITLQVNPVPVAKGSILVTASISGATVIDAEGEITDSSGAIIAQFTSTPFTWTEALVGVEYTVVCRLAGFADKTMKVTVVTDGSSVPAKFAFVVEAGFPLWAVGIAGGTLLIYGVYKLGGRKKRGRR